MRGIVVGVSGRTVAFVIAVEKGEMSMVKQGYLEQDKGGLTAR